MGDCAVCAGDGLCLVCDGVDNVPPGLVFDPSCRWCGGTAMCPHCGGSGCEPRTGTEDDR